MTYDSYNRTWDTKSVDLDVDAARALDRIRDVMSDYLSDECVPMSQLLAAIEGDIVCDGWGGEKRPCPDCPKRGERS